MLKDYKLPKQALKQFFMPPLTVCLYCALLTALGVVLKSLSFSIPLGGMLLSRLGFQLLTVYLAAMLFGPIMGAITGALVDIISTLITPVGSYNPLYTLTMLIAGVLAWTIYYSLSILRCDGKKGTLLEIVRIALTVTTVQLIVLFLNTAWITLFSGGESAYWALFAARSTSLIFYLPVFTVLLCILLPVLRPFSCKAYKTRKQ